MTSLYIHIYSIIAWELYFLLTRIPVTWQMECYLCLHVSLSLFSCLVYIYFVRLATSLPKYIELHHLTKTLPCHGEPAEEVQYFILIPHWLHSGGQKENSCKTQAIIYLVAICFQPHGSSRSIRIAPLTERNFTVDSSPFHDGTVFRFFTYPLFRVTLLFYRTICCPKISFITCKSWSCNHFKPYLAVIIKSWRQYWSGVR